MIMSEMGTHTIFPALDRLVLPRNLVDELPDWRPQFVSVQAAKRFALLTRAEKPARPFNEELDLDLLSTLAKAICLTRTGEVRRERFIWWLLASVASSSSSAGERDGDGLASLFPFPLEARRCMKETSRKRQKAEIFSKKESGVLIPQGSSQLKYRRPGSTLNRLRSQC